MYSVLVKACFEANDPELKHTDMKSGSSHGAK